MTSRDNASRLGGAALAILVAISLTSNLNAQQTLFLDFDSGTDGSINYTSSMRSDIVFQIQSIYGAFDITVTETAPVVGLFSTVTFNSGGAGGLAEDIDFRNLNKSDNAVVNVDGFGFSTTAEFVSSSAVIGAHESGHLFGLRHHDSFGPIGSGISPDANAGSWFPDYPGPQGAIETNDHIMASPASVGSSLDDTLTPSWLSERSAIKLTYAEQGIVGSELGDPNDTIATAQAFDWENMLVPNTIVAGMNAGLGDFDVDTHALIGRMDNIGDIDFYQFEALAGDLINIEIMSNAPNRMASDSIDPTVSVFDSDGNFVDYYGVDAFSDDELENLDSQILDLVLGTAGTYFIQINAFDSDDTGDYELFISRFNGVATVPEPGSLAMIGLFGLALAVRRRRSAILVHATEKR